MSTNSQPIASRTFHAPEIWLILQTLGTVDSNLKAPPEIAANQNEIRDAQAHLLKQRLLLPRAGKKVRLAPEIEALIRPAAFPETVFVANIADSARFGKFARLICFGWTPEALAVNWVDEANDHHFELYSPEAAPGVVVDHLFKVCNLEVDDAPTVPDNFGPREMEHEMEQMKQSVTLMAVNGIQAPQQTTWAMGWFVSDRRVWLMQSAGQNEQLAPQLTNRAGVESAVAGLVEQALAAGESVAG